MAARSRYEDNLRLLEDNFEAKEAYINPMSLISDFIWLSNLFQSAVDSFTPPLLAVRE